MDELVHAVSIGVRDEGFPWQRVLIDLDYIVRWVDPAFGRQHFSFWIAPATLVFDEAWDITAELDPGNDLLEIADLHRLAPAAASASQKPHSPEQRPVAAQLSAVSTLCMGAVRSGRDGADLVHKVSR
jgi:hypothetical protein